MSTGNSSLPLEIQNCQNNFNLKDTVLLNPAVLEVNIPLCISGISNIHD